MNSLLLGCDCFGYIEYLDAHFCDSRGRTLTIPNAICIHEEDHLEAVKKMNSKWKSWSGNKDLSTASSTGMLFESVTRIKGSSNGCLPFLGWVDCNSSSCSRNCSSRYGARGLPSPDVRAAAQAAAEPHSLRKQLSEIVRNVSAIKAIPETLISPDGTQIAYTVADGELGTEQLFVTSLSGSPSGSKQVQPILMHADTASVQLECRTGEPAWSSNSTELASLSDCMSSGAGKGQMQLFVLDTAQPGTLPQQRNGSGGMDRVFRQVGAGDTRK